MAGTKRKQAQEAPKYKRVAEAIYRRGDSLAVVVNLGIDPETGKRKQRWETLPDGASLDDARAKRTELLHQRNKDELVMNPTKWTVAEYLAHWLDTYVAQNCDVKTESGYRSVVDARIVPLLGSVPLVKLTAAHIRAAYTKLLREGRSGAKNPKPLSPRSVHHTHRVLSEALKHAVRWQMISKNVADLVDPPKAKGGEMKTWTAEQARRFLEVATARTDDGDEAILYGTAMALALLTGARQGEVLGLRWQDVDLAGGTISITQTVKRIHKRGILIGMPKTRGSRRRIDLEPATIELLRAHKAEQNREKLILGADYQNHGLVFATPLGTPIDGTNLTHSFYRAAAKAGVRKIRFHDLRHTHATLMLSQNENPKVVSERLGHASIAITMDIYSHAVPGMQKAAAARLGALLWGTGTTG